MEWRKQKHWELAALALAGLLLAYAVIISAWVCDDAYITFRTVDNFLHGFGLRWNVAERVQTFTHPLWLLLLIPATAIAGNPYPAALVLGAALTLAAAFIFVRWLAESAEAATLGLVLLAVSKFFVDYATSGLENPLSYFLLAVFCAGFLKLTGPRRQWALGLAAGLLALNRPDAILLVLPALALAFWQERGLKIAARMAAGFLPLLAWEAFSLVYYGFLFPNTAYAKLHIGVPARQLVIMGLNYLASSLLLDPLGVAVIVAALALALLPNNRRLLPLAAGITLHLVYILKIGGDFMAGRFLAGPILLSAFILTAPAPTSSAPRGTRYLLAALLVAISLLHPLSSLRPNPQYGSATPEAFSIYLNGVEDERAFYYPNTGWLGPHLTNKRVTLARELQARGITLYHEAGIGFFGYTAGPDIYIIDSLGLADPLLARLYPLKHRVTRAGHFYRYLPRGYWKTLETGRNAIVHPQLATYYDRLRLVTSGRLFDPDRLREILRFTLGGNDGLLQAYETSPLRLPVFPKETSDDEITPHVFPPSNPLFSVKQLEFDRRMHPIYFEVILGPGRQLDIAYLLDGKVIARQFADDRLSHDPLCKIMVPPEATRAGIDSLQFRYRRGLNEIHILPQLVAE